MYTIKTSKHFEKFTDKSGADYYVLKTHVAAQQQGFYFVSPSMDKDAKYLWFYCSFPPEPYLSLGVVDFEADEVRYFPDSVFSGLPSVEEETGYIFYSDKRYLYRRSPFAEDRPEVICDLEAAFAKHGLKIRCPYTHITFSPDKTEAFLDSQTDKGSVTGVLDLKTGEYTIWSRPDFLRNHGQFNPVYKDIALTAEEFQKDENGNFKSIRTDENGVFMRLWTTTRDGKEKVWPPLDLEKATHEWWSHDGTKIYYCRYLHQNDGICGVNIFTGEHKLYAPVNAWHGFSSKDDTLFVFDENDWFYRGCPSRVGLYNTKTQKKVYYNSQNPALNPPDKPNNYHLDPHPRFNANDKYIVFTTVVDHHTELAVAITEDIVALTE